MTVAWREFCSVVFTKGFLLGILLPPVIMAVAIGAMFLVQKMKGPRVTGEVAVIDRSGLVAPFVEKRFSEESEKKEAEKNADQALEVVKETGAGEILEKQGGAGQMGLIRQQAVAAQMAGPLLTPRVLASDADAEAEKEPVKTAQIKMRKQEGGEGKLERLGLVVIPEKAVVAGQDEAFAGFEAYFAKGLDFEVQKKVESRIADAVVDARLEVDAGLKAGGVSAEYVRKLLRRPGGDSKTLTPEGEKSAAGPWGMFVAMGFMLLLFIAVMTGGQSLLTTLVEEKSNRVMEVLLSAVSPMQLMAGKIIGQMGGGLVLLVVYGGAGMAALVAMSRADLVSPSLLVYALVFFLIAYFLFASLLAAIGAAVNELREAQSLQTPVIMLMVLPWMTWFLIQRAPNSTFAVVGSFVPGINPFVLMLRLCGSEPIPQWQVILGIVVGVLSVIGAMWFAAKVFRIGVLMYGKPPNLATLIRWVRMA